MLGHDLIKIFNPDYEIFGIDIHPDKTSKNKVFPADITDRTALESVFAEIEPWLVIHAAAFTNVDAAEAETEQAKAVNVTGSENIAFLCKKYKAKLVLISTDYVFDGKKTIPYIESDIPNPINLYGYSKLAAEQVVSKHLSEYLIVRTSWLFGLKGKNFVSTIKNKAIKDGALKVVDDQIGSPTYTVNLAQGLSWLIKQAFQLSSDQANYGIYHLSNSGQCSWYEFAQAILELSEIKAVIEPVDSDYIMRAAKRPAFSVLNKSRFEKFTGKKLCPWKEALSQYLLEEKNQIL